MAWEKGCGRHPHSTRPGSAYGGPRQRVASDKQLKYIRVLCEQTGYPLPKDMTFLGRKEAKELIDKLRGMKKPQTGVGQPYNILEE